MDPADEATIQSLETLSRCVTLLNQRCNLLQSHIDLLQAKINEILETT